jgi:hypothetical protein
MMNYLNLFVNFISFQEMEPHIVKNYLGHVSRLKAKWILLRNMREGKQIRKNGLVGVDTPILSEDYLIMLPDYELVEEKMFGILDVEDFEEIDGHGFDENDFELTEDNDYSEDQDFAEEIIIDEE